MKNNKWTTKPTKKTSEGNASKVKTLSWSSFRQMSAKKDLIHDFEGIKGGMGVFMA